jgi:predicted RNA-binding protein YlqC (UPF0109 family)
MMAQRDVGAELAWMVDGIVKQMVSDPERAFVTGENQGGAVIVRVVVAAADMGRVIGKSGITARSLRTILDAAAANNGIRVQLNIEEAA